MTESVAPTNSVGSGAVAKFDPLLPIQNKKKKLRDIIPAKK
jgi:hypothetical protein